MILGAPVLEISFVQAKFGVRRVRSMMLHDTPQAPDCDNDPPLRQFPPLAAGRVDFGAESW